MLKKRPHTVVDAVVVVFFYCICCYQQISRFESLFLILLLFYGIQFHQADAFNSEKFRLFLINFLLLYFHTHRHPIYTLFLFARPVFISKKIIHILFIRSNLHCSKILWKICKLKNRYQRTTTKGIKQNETGKKNTGKDTSWIHLIFINELCCLSNYSILTDELKSIQMPFGMVALTAHLTFYYYHYAKEEIFDYPVKSKDRI